MLKQWLERADQRSNNAAHAFGNLLVDSFHNLALFAIGGTIIWSAVHAFYAMMTKGSATIDDILVLALATLVVRYGSARYPSAKSDNQP